MSESQRRSTSGIGLGSVGLLGIAVLAISSSAVLVRWAEAGAVALAFWRTVGGSIALAPFAARSSSHRAMDSRSIDIRWLIVGAGVALAVHFASWLASLEMTSIAASVTLVSTAPVFVALLHWAFGGARPQTRTWLAIALTVVGVAIITGGDFGTSGRELAGDLLALLGAVSMAVYLVLGQRARAELGATDYAARTYAVAALTLLPMAIVTQTSLVGFDEQTWLVIAAMILGPQLAGHTVLNVLLKRLGSLTVSLALLAEPVGASLLAWSLLGEVPPRVAWIGTPIVLAGLAIHLLSAQQTPSAQPAPSELGVDLGGVGQE